VSLLASMASPQVHRRRGSLLLVPLGSTEQHGAHLPVSTDTVLAEALATGGADALEGAVVAPTIPYGSSGEHAGFPGTLSIGQAATELLLLELVRSAGPEFSGIVVISTHGGNTEPVERAITLLRHEGRPAWAWGPRWGGDGHAGRTETSLLLAIDPRMVDLEAAAPGNTLPVPELLPRLRVGGVQSVSDNGVLGDPSGASAEEGRRLLADAIGDLVAFAQSHQEAAGHLPSPSGAS